MSTSGGSGGGGLSSATVHLDAAAIGTLFSVPVELIAAPGADRFVHLFDLAYETVGGNSAWYSPDGGVYYADHVDAGESIDPDLVKLHMFGDTAPDPQVYTTAVLLPAALDTTEVANSAVVVADPTSEPERSAPIATTSIDDPGAGYVPGDTGTIDDSIFGTDTGYVVDTVGALGVVTSMHLALSTAGYKPSESPFTTTAGGAQPGIGTGLEINVLTIAAASGDLYVTAFYRTVTTH